MFAVLRVVCIAALFAACQSTPAPKPSEAPAPAAPAADPLELTGLEPGKQTLVSLDLLLSGKLGPDVADRTLSWTATTSGTVIGEGEVTLEPDADGAFTVTLPVSFGEDRESLEPYQDDETVEVVVRASVGEGDEAFEASRTRWVRSPLLPVVEMISVQASRDVVGALSLTYMVNIRNPNPFEVGVSTLSYEALLAGKVVASGDLPLGNRIPGSAASTFELPAQANAQNLGADLQKVLRSTETDWGFTGILNARSVKLPFDLAGKLPLSQP